MIDTVEQKLATVLSGQIDMLAEHCKRFQTGFGPDDIDEMVRRVKDLKRDKDILKEAFNNQNGRTEDN